VKNKYDQKFAEIDSLIELYQTIEFNGKIESSLRLSKNSIFKYD
jgi:hypothetical protein